jgi:hypothetical protein
MVGNKTSAKDQTSKSRVGRRVDGEETVRRCFVRDLGDKIAIGGRMGKAQTENVGALSIVGEMNFEEGENVRRRGTIQSKEGKDMPIGGGWQFRREPQTTRYPREDGLI